MKFICVSGRMRSFSLLLVCVLVVNVYSASYYEMKNVVILDEDNFENYTNDGRWLIIFFMKTCAGCQRYSQIFEKIAIQLETWQPILKVGATDCAITTSTKYCKMYDVAGVPALRYINKKNKIMRVLKAEKNSTIILDELRNQLLSEDLEQMDPDTEKVWTYIMSEGVKPIFTTASPTDTTMKRLSTSQSELATVYADDIFKSLSQLLYTDVSLFNEIRGDSLDALKEFLFMLMKVLPCSDSYRKMLVDLHEWVSQKTEITGAEWPDKLAELKFPVFDGDFVHCKGSQPTYRGYPCGLWILFHSLTVEHYKLNQKGENLPGDFVAHALHRFVPRFFSCIVCSFHFAANTLNIARVGESVLPDRQAPPRSEFVFDMHIVTQLPASPKTAKSEVLWLNRLHNRVNRRLSGAVTEDPASPKLQYPPQKLCPSCWSAKGGEHAVLGETPETEDALFNFLVKHYDSESWKLANVDERFMERDHSQSSENTYDTHYAQPVYQWDNLRSADFRQGLGAPDYFNPHAAGTNAYRPTMSFRRPRGTPYLF